MKDYSIDLVEQKDFILDFDVDDNGKIIVNFANGLKWPLPYNEKNINLILDKMRNQVEASNKFTEKKKKEKAGFVAYTILSFGGAALMATFGLFYSNVLAVDIFSYAMAVFFAGTGVYGVSRMARVNSVLKDLAKNKWFLSVEEKLNKSIRKEENALINVSKYTKETIQDISEDVQVFNINSFNYVPFKDLEQIMDNVSRNERFGFDYTSNYSLEERPKTRTRRKEEQN